MNKKGQFYLVAAVIIIFVLIGAYAYTNYAKSKQNYSKLYNLGDELGVETGYVYDYGVYNKEDTQQLVEQWAGVYYNYSQNIVENWIFVYGNKDNVTALYFTKEDVGEICVSISGKSCIKMTKTVQGEKGTARDVNAPVNVNIAGYDYTFDLKEGENFFFVIRAGEYTAGS